MIFMTGAHDRRPEFGKTCYGLFMHFTRRNVLGSACLTLLASSVGAQEADGFFTLEARPGATPLLAPPAPPTKIWGFGGLTPGPLLRVRLGQEMRVRLVNRLDQPTSLHWRGMRLPNAIDGAAGLVRKPLAPGETQDIRFVPPDAGTYFYQPLIQPFSGEQLGRGLYGAAIVDEPNPVAVDDDLVLLLDDWRLDASGQIVGDFEHPADALRQGRYGAVTGVNGRAGPASLIHPPGARLRLRLVNASNARIMRLAFEGGAQTVIALDGQFCDPFPPLHGTVPLGPGARCDMLLDLPRQEGQGARLILRGETELPDAVVLDIATRGAVRPAAPPVTHTPLNPLLPAEIRLQGAKRFELNFDGGWRKGMPAGFRPPAEELRRIWKINGRASSGLDGPPLFSVARGSAVVLALVNKSLFDLSIFFQGHVVRLLHDLDDGWEPYWRDSVIVPERATKHVAFIAGNRGKWLIGGAIQEHFANGMAGWFEVA
ncbi:multicopper oxidase family protein [uncultured Rhodoblastus sp.]|uniref:multicopper oxidase family protein n=1 Tax=uncultured Rhodoblastus sp. TaxID=543037 RepID=UPI0025FD53BF|nr:multicopper oxidase family protein [uncultured Rhodoblastus sp.]